MRETCQKDGTVACKVNQKDLIEFGARGGGGGNLYNTFKKSAYWDRQTHMEGRPEHQRLNKNRRLRGQTDKPTRDYSDSLQVLFLPKINLVIVLIADNDKILSPRLEISESPLLLLLSLQLVTSCVSNNSTSTWKGLEIRTLTLPHVGPK